ncbi:MAG: phosphocholine cytidylyltransferase family protein [Ectothiorhodospiraceae bacterium]|nr:phosphocholine cytidylyltransferase family protein [Chromatiales bacterium]MCP5155708.1 phosphocholine cytidylyltransferase family protein [Ectothiorhodospiraceae bacterium]
MRAIILAAGVGMRLGGGMPPKSLIRFDERSLLERHLASLRALDVAEVEVGIGYEAEAMRDELRALGVGSWVHTTYNPDYHEGNVVTLACVAHALRRGGDVLLMDADVLYHRALMERLVRSRHGNCFLLDRDIEPGEEPVKICVRDGAIVEFRKAVAPDLVHDFHGESVGFFKLGEAMAVRLADTADAYLAAGRRGEYYEEALRDLVLADSQAFGFEDITGLPWIEIDFQADIERARAEVLPRIHEMEAA